MRERDDDAARFEPEKRNAARCSAEAAAAWAEEETAKGRCCTLWSPTNETAPNILSRWRRRRSVPPGPTAAPSAPKVTVHSRPPLPMTLTLRTRVSMNADDGGRTKRRWGTRPDPKTDLWKYLSLKTQRVLEHTSHVPPDSTYSIDDVLDALQRHIKDSSNKALQ